MSSKCPVPDCSFRTDNGESFNSHMRAHDASRQAEADRTQEEAEAEEERLREAARVEEVKDEIAAELERAKQVVGPFIEAVNVLLHDPDTRGMIVSVLKTMFGEVKAEAATEPAKE